MVQPSYQDTAAAGTEPDPVTPTMCHVAEIALPDGHHYAAMWGIPDNYAGMTNSMLRRSRAFVEMAGAEVTILTYEHR